MSVDEDQNRDKVITGFAPITLPSAVDTAAQYQPDRIEDLYPVLKESIEERMARMKGVLSGGEGKMSSFLYLGGKEDEIRQAVTEDEVPAQVIKHLYEVSRDLPSDVLKSAARNYLPLSRPGTGDPAIELFNNLTTENQNEPELTDEFFNKFNKVSFTNFLAGLSSALSREQRTSLAVDLTNKYNSDLTIKSFETRKTLSVKVVDSLCSGFSREELNSAS